MCTDDSAWINECSFFSTNQQLLQYITKPFSWNNLVEPLTTRCDARKFGDRYLNIEDRPNNSLPTPDENIRRKVLVCHDMAGNYRGDRLIRGSKKFDDYRFYQWAGIDYFNYFSHHYVTIPPVPWINAGHRNGVPVLGTIIIEFEKAKKLIDEILRSTQDIYQYVEAFVLVTKNFGFDGWLLNVECDIDFEQVAPLKEFQRQLKKRIHEEIPNGVVFWFDSVIESGLLRWQSEVNERNIEMYRGSDGMLLNYWWDSSHLRRTVNILQNKPEDLAKVLVGIDVFGRGHIGGFHSQYNLRFIEEFNMSTGIFAPGWTFETMPDEHPMNPEGTDRVNKKFLERNTRFWTSLWPYFYLRGPNTLPFYTSFCLGSGKKLYREGIQVSNEPWFNLMKQQYQPSVPPSCEYHYEEAYNGGSCPKFTGAVHNMRLFTTDFPCKDNLIVSFVFKRPNPQISVRLVLNVQNEKGDQNLLIYCDGDVQQYNTNIIVKSFEHTVNPLKSNLLRYTVVGLSDRHEKIFPSSIRPINGWETRYFYLNFDDIAKHGRVTDIGITVNKENWNETDSLLLGALHIHSGIRDGEIVTDMLPKISFGENDGL